MQITKQFIGTFLPENPIILEAGAHIGRDTIKMAKLWPNGRIYCFEPVPELFKAHQENTKNYPNITCFNYCLSNKTEIKNFWVSSGRSTALSSLFEPTGGLALHPDTKFTQIQVPCLELDKWAEVNNINKIDFMWLDMQGAELFALQAGLKILSTVTAILIEASLSERYKDTPMYQEIRDWLESRGFELMAEDEPKHNKVNLFYVRKSK